MSTALASTLAPAVPAGPLHCERCGQAFRCGALDAQPCACTALRLSADQRKALSARYRHCLCLVCLAQIDAGHAI